VYLCIFGITGKRFVMVVVWVWKFVENSDGFCYDLGLGPCLGFSVCNVDLDQCPFSTKQSLSPYTKLIIGFDGFQVHNLGGGAGFLMG
jgi:hypothetical protein